MESTKQIEEMSLVELISQVPSENPEIEAEWNKFVEEMQELAQELPDEVVAEDF